VSRLYKNLAVLALVVIAGIGLGVGVPFGEICGGTLIAVYFIAALMDWGWGNVSGD
jgi:uncharacterized transporter YbjL